MKISKSTERYPSKPILPGSNMQAANNASIHKLFSYFSKNNHSPRKESVISKKVLDFSMIEPHQNNKNNQSCASTQRSKLKQDTLITDMNKQKSKQLPIKSRDKKLIRNKKLSMDMDINLPQIKYKIPLKLKAPNFADSQQKITKEIYDVKNYNNVTNKSLIEIRGGERKHTQRSVYKRETVDPNQLMQIIKDVDRLEKHRKNNLLHKVDEYYGDVISEKEILSSRKLSKHLSLKSTNLEEVKEDIRKIQSTELKSKYDFLNSLHTKVFKKHINDDPNYKGSKNIFSQYKQKKILESKDYSINSKLHIMNRNPIMQINKNANAVFLIDDPSIMVKFYNVNMFKLETNSCLVKAEKHKK